MKMFHVGRFDPKAENDKSRKKKVHQNKANSRKAPHNENNQGSLSTLRVIAPEEKVSAPKKRLTDEALDDFDIVSDLLLLEDNEHAETEEATATSNEWGSSEADAREPKLNVAKEVARALHMSTLPIEEAAKAWELAPFLVENLLKDGYDHFFPIQALVIPDVIASERHSQILQCRDICVASPTGSGKTLSFCLPVLNSLSTRVVRRLRALIILPSRDLASQVYQVFERYAKGSDLKIGLATGQSDFQQEQRTIMVGERSMHEREKISTLRLRYQLDPTNLALAMEIFGREEGPIDTDGAIDVLVATPGRLIDHLEKTPAFSLQHLRFLVIDEADRLVSQSYHSFVARIMESVNSTSHDAWNQIKESGTFDCELDLRPITWRRPVDSVGASLSIYSRVCQQIQLRKLLFSATLTRDPQKLASLGLVNPKFYDSSLLRSSTGKASQRYNLPSGLSEFIVECTAEQKPLFLLSLLLEYKKEGEIMVVFTSSLDTTHRLARLLQLLWKASVGDPSCVAEFSSALNQTQRTNLVRQCNETRDIVVVVCSDGLSRGMDISSVSVVFNYDVPSFAKTYVHRCGRTARAGRLGTAISLLKGGQANQFQRIRQLIEDPKRVQVRSVKKELVLDAFTQYKFCVSKLRGIIEREKNGDLNPIAPLPKDVI
jgi:ATP-dependent RNA helicase DDX51/DBP6